MDSIDVRNLYNAYRQVCESQQSLNESVDLDEAKVDDSLSDNDKKRSRNDRQNLSTRSRVFRHVETRGQKSEKGYNHPDVSDNQGNQPGKYLRLKSQKGNDLGYDGPVRGSRKTGDSYYDEALDTYDLVLEYLLDEGYCDDEQAAEVIMANMSEEWLEGILSEASVDEDERNRRFIRRT